MFGFPKVEKPQNFQFKKNFLKSVVFQVKYENNSNILQNNEKITKYLIEKYPNKNTLKQIGIGFTIKGDKTPILHPQQNQDNGLRFSTKTNDKIIDFTNDTFTHTIVGDAYENFNIFLNEIENFKFLFNICEIKTFNRIAIRKSNFIEYIPNNEDNSNAHFLDILPQMLNNALVTNSQMCPAYEYQKEGVAKMLFQKDFYTLNLQYGVIKTSEQPLVNALFLDIDLFNTEQNTNIDKLNSILEEINNEIYDVFSWSITDNLKNVLNS